MTIVYVAAFLTLVGSLVAFLMYQEEKLENSKRAFENVHEKFRLELKRATVRPMRRQRRNRSIRSRN